MQANNAQPAPGNMPLEEAAKQGIAGELPQELADLAEKLHGAVVDLLHGPMRDKTTELLDKQQENLPSAMANLVPVVLDTLEDKMGGRLPPAVTFRMLVIITMELVEIAQAMGLVTEDDEQAYNDLIPPVIEQAASMLGKSAQKNGVVSPEQLQMAQQTMQDMGGAFSPQGSPDDIPQQPTEPQQPAPQEF